MNGIHLDQSSYFSEKKMATHSSILAWKIPGTEEPGGLLSIGSHRVGHDWSDLASIHALEKEMATHSSILAWKIPGTEEPGGLPSMGSHRLRHDWSDLAAAEAGQEESVYVDSLIFFFFFVTLLLVPEIGTGLKHRKLSWEENFEPWSIEKKNHGEKRSYLRHTHLKTGIRWSYWNATG